MHGGLNTVYYYHSKISAVLPHVIYNINYSSLAFPCFK